MNVIAMPYIDRTKCDGCGLCIGVCRSGALKMVDNVVCITETETCSWCTQCEAVCATGAIGCPFEIVVEAPRGKRSS